MPRQPTAPPGTRFFARVRTFDWECPSCAEVYKARVLAPGQKTTGRLAHRGSVQFAYNPWTSTLRCPACRAVYQVGLILWPLPKGGHGGQRAMPEDMRPDKRQRAVLRGYASGIWAEQVKARGDAVNVYVAAECSCPMVDGGWSPGCPVHGVRAREEREAAEAAEADEP